MHRTLTSRKDTESPRDGEGSRAGLLEEEATCADCCRMVRSWPGGD